MKCTHVLVARCKNKQTFFALSMFHAHSVILIFFFNMKSELPPIPSPPPQDRSPGVLACVLGLSQANQALCLSFLSKVICRLTPPVVSSLLPLKKLGLHGVGGGVGHNHSQHRINIL